MPQTRSNKSQTPINSDAFNLIPDLATFSDSLGVVIPVTDDAEGDTIATARAAAGWPVTDARPLFVYNTTTKTARLKNTSGWRNLIDSTAVPFGHVGKTDGFQAITTLAKNTFTAAQHLKGGVTFDNTNDNLVVPVAGLYRISFQHYTSGAGSGTQVAAVYVGVTQIGISSRYGKDAAADTVSHGSGIYQLAANDTVSLHSEHTANVSSWGTNGYNGTYLEVEYRWAVT